MIDILAISQNFFHGDQKKEAIQIFKDYSNPDF